MSFLCLKPSSGFPSHLLQPPYFGYKALTDLTLTDPFLHPPSHTGPWSGPYRHHAGAHLGASALMVSLILTACLCPPFDSELSFYIPSQRGLPWPPHLKSLLCTHSPHFNSLCSSYMLISLSLISSLSLSLSSSYLSPPPECKIALSTPESSALTTKPVYGQRPINIRWRKWECEWPVAPGVNTHSTAFCLCPSSPGPDWIMSGFACHGNEPSSEVLEPLNKKPNSWGRFVNMCEIKHKKES